MLLACLLLLALTVFLSAATIEIIRVTGPSGSQSFDDVTASDMTFNAADITFDGTDHPVQIPSSGGPNYSFWASLRLNCSVAPPTKINNIYLYSDGSNTLGVGVGCVIGTVSGINNDPNTNYVEATGIVGISGDLLDNSSYPGVGTPADFFSYTVSAPLSIPGEFVTGTDSAGAAPAGLFADWIVKQLSAATTAAPGVTPSEMGTIIWDEF